MSTFWFIILIISIFIVASLLGKLIRWFMIYTGSKAHLEKDKLLSIIETTQKNRKDVNEEIANNLMKDVKNERIRTIRDIETRIKELKDNKPSSKS